MRHIVLCLTTYLLATCLGFADGGTGSVPINNGDKVAFLGDSITAGQTDACFVNLVAIGLKINGREIQALNCGGSGNTSKHMLDRLDRDVIDKKPQVMVLSAGVNDVYQITVDEYKTTMTNIVDKAQAAGIKVVLLTPSMTGEDTWITNANNIKLIPFLDVVRNLAKEKNCILVDINAEMHKIFDEHNSKLDPAAPKHLYITVDGTHMSPVGNQMFARCILTAFGLDATQIAKAREAWLDIPKSATVAPSPVTMTIRQYETLYAISTKEGKSMQDWMQEQIAQKLAEESKQKP